MGNPATSQIIGITDASVYGTDVTAPYRFITLASTSISGVSVTLDPRKGYTLAHDGQNEQGTSDTNTIYMAVSGNVVCSPASADGKLKLLNGRSVDIGPGLQILSFQTAAGTPTFTLIPGDYGYGKF